MVIESYSLVIHGFVVFADPLVSLEEINQHPASNPTSKTAPASVTLSLDCRISFLMIGGGFTLLRGQNCS